MAMFFDKLGKESKDMLGKGFGTNKTFKFETTAVEGLTFESESVEKGGKLANTTSFKLTDESGAMDVKYEYKYADGGKGDTTLAFESNYDMAKLNLVPGLKVILSGDNKCNLKTAIEYSYEKLVKVKADFALSEKDAQLVQASSLAVGVGMDQFGAGFSIKDIFTMKGMPDVTVNYLDKGVAGATVLYGKGGTTLDVRAIYFANKELQLAAAFGGLLKDVKTIGLGGEFKIDGDTKLKFKLDKFDTTGTVMASNFAFGVKKTLKKGCDLEILYTTPKISAISDLGSHQVGFGLTLKA